MQTAYIHTDNTSKYLCKTITYLYLLHVQLILTSALGILTWYSLHFSDKGGPEAQVVKVNFPWAHRGLGVTWMHPGHPIPNSMQPKSWDIQGPGSKLGSGRHSLRGFWLSIQTSIYTICLVLLICSVWGANTTNCDSARLRRESKTEEEEGQWRPPTEPPSSVSNPPVHLSFTQWLFWAPTHC